MSATVLIDRLTGSGAGSGADITGINTRANSFDTNTTGDTTNPVQVPASSSNYSYWVTTRLNVTVTPSGTINNLRWYTSGSNPFGTGVTCIGAKASTGANAGYRQATGTPGTTGTVLNGTNHTGLDATAVNVFTFTSGSPLTLTGSITNPSTGLFGDMLVYQIAVDSTAGPGATPTATFTWKWDET